MMRPISVACQRQWRAADAQAPFQPGGERGRVPSCACMHQSDVHIQTDREIVHALAEFCAT
eukprot:2450321-Pyramimonas_sp.AAC.1